MSYKKYINKNIYDVVKEIENNIDCKIYMFENICFINIDCIDEIIMICFEDNKKISCIYRYVIKDIFN